MTTTTQEPRHRGPKQRLCAAFANKAHAERLGTLVLVMILELAVDINMAHHMLAVVVAGAVFCRDLTLILFYAEEM